MGLDVRYCALLGGSFKLVSANDHKARLILLLEEEYVERGLKWHKVHANIANVRVVIDDVGKQESNVGEGRDHRGNFNNLGISDGGFRAFLFFSCENGLGYFEGGRGGGCLLGAERDF